MPEVHQAGTGEARGLLLQGALTRAASRCQGRYLHPLLLTVAAAAFFLAFVGPAVACDTQRPQTAEHHYFDGWARADGHHWTYAAAQILEKNPTPKGSFSQPVSAWTMLDDNLGPPNGFYAQIGYMVFNDGERWGFWQYWDPSQSPPYVTGYFAPHDLETYTSYQVFDGNNGYFGLYANNLLQAAPPKLFTVNRAEFEGELQNLGSQMPGIASNHEVFANANVTSPATGNIWFNGQENSDNHTLWPNTLIPPTQEQIWDVCHA